MSSPERDGEDQERLGPQLAGEETVHAPNRDLHPPQGGKKLPTLWITLVVLAVLAVVGIFLVRAFGFAD